MFRLILCSPERETVGPDCLKDVSHHVVLSYRANVEDLGINKMKGLFGGYPSQLYALPMSEVQAEYNLAELRDLQSLPLKLTPAQKTAFIYRVLEQYWEYQGRYYFITNNCASEAMGFLRGVIDSPQVRAFSGLNPQRIRDQLVASGLADESVLADEWKAIESGYLFKSRKEYIEHSLAGLLAVDPNFPKDGTPEARRHWISQYVPTAPDARRSFLARAFTQESYIQAIKEKKLMNKVAGIAVKNHDQQTTHDLVDLNTNVNHWGRLASGYGVPLERDFIPQAHFQADAEKKTAHDRLKSWVTQEFGTELKELDAIEDNKAYIQSLF
jgi:hypothetical protein